jgi:hypothetical protein
MLMKQKHSSQRGKVIDDMSKSPVLRRKSANATTTEFSSSTTTRLLVAEKHEGGDNEKNKISSEIRKISSDQRIKRTEQNQLHASPSCEEICQTADQNEDDTFKYYSLPSYYTTTSQSKGSSSKGYHSSKSAKDRSKKSSFHSSTDEETELQLILRKNNTEKRDGSKRGSKKYHRRKLSSKSSNRGPEWTSPLTNHSSSLTRRRKKPLGYNCCDAKDGVSFLKVNLVGTGKRGKLYIRQDNPSCKRKSKKKYHYRRHTSTKSSYLSNTAKSKGSNNGSKISILSQDSYLERVRFIDCNDPCIDNLTTNCDNPSSKITVGDGPQHHQDVCFASFDPISEKFDFGRKLPDQVFLILVVEAATGTNNNTSSTTSETTLEDKSYQEDEAGEPHYYHSIIQTTCTQPIYPPFTMDMSVSCKENQDIRPFAIDEEMALPNNLTHPIIQFKGGLSTSFHYHYGKNNSTDAYSSFGECNLSARCNCTDMKKNEVTMEEYPPKISNSPSSVVAEDNHAHHTPSSQVPTMPTIMPSIRTTNEITSLQSPAAVPPPTTTDALFCNLLCLEWIAFNCLIPGDEDTNQRPCIINDDYYYFNNAGERTLFLDNADNDTKTLHYHKRMAELIDHLLHAYVLSKNLHSL